MVKKLIYNLKWQRFHPQAFRRYQEVLAGERLSADELCDRKEKCRKQIVASAFENSPFYRRLYEASGFSLSDMRTEAWFEQLPVVTKDDLRSHFDEFVNPRLHGTMGISTTGGSTGIPVKTGCDKRIPLEVYSWRLQGWFGVHPWEDHAYIWRETRKSAFRRAVNDLLWWPTKHLKLDASVMSEESISRFVSKYRRLKPSLLYGYVGALSHVAEWLESHPEHSGENENLKVVWATSAPISKVQRCFIERVFGAKVCDQYGSCEISSIAQQCPQCGGLHVNVEHVDVEFVDDKNRPVAVGEHGKTLLTDLENEAFPLIRYENGDRGRWLGGECPCGRTLPLMDSVKGREVESFSLPDGRVVNGEFLTTIFDDVPESVKGFRVVQHRDMSMTVECVPAEGLGKKIALDAVKRFADKVGYAARVDCIFVSSISHDKGKQRYIVKES